VTKQFIYNYGYDVTKLWLQVWVSKRVRRVKSSMRWKQQWVKGWRNCYRLHSKTTYKRMDQSNPSANISSAFRFPSHIFHRNLVGQMLCRGIVLVLVCCGRLSFNGNVVVGTFPHFFVVDTIDLGIFVAAKTEERT